MVVDADVTGLEFVLVLVAVVVVALLGDVVTGLVVAARPLGFGDIIFILDLGPGPGMKEPRAAALVGL